MSPLPTTSNESPDEPDAVAAPKPLESESKRLHDFGNELGVIQGFTWLALSSLRQLCKKLEGNTQADLQSIVSLVERIKASAEQGLKLLGLPDGAPTPPAAEPPPASKCRILVVDDSLPLLTLLSKVLSDAGYDVDAFTDPATALQRFAETPDAFDIVVTDDLMPDMPGATLAGKIGAIRAATPVIRCTGAAGSEYSGAGDWAQAVIRKPYRARQLVALVANVIAEAAKAPSHTSVACTAGPNPCDDRANAQ